MNETITNLLKTLIEELRREYPTTWVYQLEEVVPNILEDLATEVFLREVARLREAVDRASLNQK